MKIEITKKQLIVAAISIALIAVSGIIFYNVGFSKGYDEAVAKYENPKGDGIHFYMESYKGNQPSSFDEADQLLYHSTLNCPNIKFGAEKDRYGIYYTSWKRKVPYFFCSKCMDNELITACERRIISAYPEDIKQ